MPNGNDIIYNRIDTLLEKKQMSRRKLAQSIGVPPSTLQSAFEKKSNLSLERLAQIADALEVDINWLLSGFTLKEHNEEFIQRLQGKGDVSARDLYLKKHPDDEPAPAKDKAPQSDVDRLMEGLNAESIRKLREYAELLLLGQDAQTAPTVPDDKEPAEK